MICKLVIEDGQWCTRVLLSCRVSGHKILPICDTQELTRNRCAILMCWQLWIPLANCPFQGQINWKGRIWNPVRGSRLSIATCSALHCCGGPTPHTLTPESFGPNVQRWAPQASRPRGFEKSKTEPQDFKKQLLLTYWRFSVGVCEWPLGGKVARPHHRICYDSGPERTQMPFFHEVQTSQGFKGMGITPFLNPGQFHQVLHCPHHRWCPRKQPALLAADIAILTSTDICKPHRHASASTCVQVAMLRLQDLPLICCNEVDGGNTMGRSAGLSLKKFGRLLPKDFMDWPGVAAQAACLQSRQTGRPRKWLGRVLGRVLGKLGVPEQSAGMGAALNSFQHDCQHSLQWPELSQHPPQRFSGFPRLSVRSPWLFPREKGLVDSYCALPPAYLSDTPISCAMGFWVSQHEAIAIPLPPACAPEVPYPRRRGVSQQYLCNTIWKPRQKAFDTPSAILSRNGIMRHGGISHWAAKEKGREKVAYVFVVWGPGPSSITFGRAFEARIWRPWRVWGSSTSETGWIWFRRGRFQTPNSVSLLALTQLLGESSVSSFQPIICVLKRTHRVFFLAELTEFVCSRAR